MTPNTDDDGLLIHLLTQEGHSWPEIQSVLQELREHDNQTMRESVFNSIESGTFDLSAIIEAFKDRNEPQ